MLEEPLLVLPDLDKVPAVAIELSQFGWIYLEHDYDVIVRTFWIELCTIAVGGLVVMEGGRAASVSSLSVLLVLEDLDNF